MKTLSVEDQYRIIFLAAVWPERGYGVVFSKNVRKFGPTDHRKGKNWSESDFRQGKRVSTSAKFIAEGLGTSWTHTPDP